MSDYTITDFVKDHIYNTLATSYFCLPCVVLTVRDELRECRVDVQPLIDILYRDGTTEAQSPILSVPVVFPSSSTSAFTFEINVGDTVLCVFSQRSLDIFKNGSGTPLPPNDYRKLSIRDAVAIPGLAPFSKSINNPAKRRLTHSTTDAVVAHNIGTANEVEIRLKKSGDIVINAPNKNVTVNASSANINVNNTNWDGNITLNGNYTINGVLTINGIVFENHTHSGVQPGGGNSGGVVV